MRPEYIQKDEVITRPLLADFKRRIDTSMSNEEISKLLNDDQQWLRTFISQEPEIEQIQKLLNTYLTDIEDLSKSNIELKSELKKIVDQYDEKV